MRALSSKSLRAKNSPSLEITRLRFTRGKREKQIDHLSVEEPLEIILNQANKKSFPLAVTMRTPGHDQELAVGFLFSEGIIKHKNDIQRIASDTESPNPDNNITVTLSQNLDFEPDRLQRHFFTNSSCGVCGKTSIQALEMMHQPSLTSNHPKFSSTTLQQLPESLRKQQQQFSATGGVHSAALFSPDGQLLRLSEDVGRHNAMDKLIGALLLNDQLNTAREGLVLVSGRASFELVQKALMADIPILSSIGAPTSLALQLASRHNMTLIGFLKPDGFNVYSGIERII